LRTIALGELFNPGAMALTVMPSADVAGE